MGHVTSTIADKKINPACRFSYEDGKLSSSAFHHRRDTVKHVKWSAKHHEASSRHDRPAPAVAALCHCGMVYISGVVLEIYICNGVKTVLHVRRHVVLS